MFSISIAEWCAVAGSALIIGFSKTGVGGLGILSVIILANIFPAKASTGILLPILIIADIFAVIFYRHHANWKELLKLCPFAITGVIIGFLLMRKIDSSQLKPIIGCVILTLLVAHFVLNKINKNLIKPNIIFAAFMGILAGIVTMMANAAGPIMTIYLLTMNMKKQDFVGTRVWYFFLINLFKVPFSAGMGLITMESLKFDIMLIPAIATGAVLGYFLIKIIPQKIFEISIQVLAAIGAVKLIV